jgi:hypothetical protein
MGKARRVRAWGWLVRSKGPGTGALKVFDMTRTRSLVLAAAGSLLASLASIHGCSPVAAADRSRPAASPSSPPPGLSRDDVCALVQQIADLRVGGRSHSSIIDQPCTKELAATSGRIAVDVILYSGDRAIGMRPLDFGETCGRQDIVVTCDPGKADQPCRSVLGKGKDWRVALMLHSEQPNRVRAHATVLPYKPVRKGFATASPCGRREAVFERSEKDWREVPGRGGANGPG